MKTKEQSLIDNYLELRRNEYLLQKEELETINREIIKTKSELKILPHKEICELVFKSLITLTDNLIRKFSHQNQYEYISIDQSTIYEGHLFDKIYNDYLFVLNHHNVPDISSTYYFNIDSCGVKRENLLVKLNEIKNEICQVQLDSFPDIYEKTTSILFAKLLELKNEFA